MCLKNCSCTAYAYVTGIRCMIWNRDLVDVQQLAEGDGGNTLFVRVAHSELVKTDMTTLIGDRNHVPKIVVITIVVIVGAFFVSLLISLCKTKCQSQDIPGTSDEENQASGTEVGMLSFNDVAAATNNFSDKNKLGQGGFGIIYKGKLQNGQEIAVKRLAKSSNQGVEEFKNEVEVISKLQHRNLVKLLGCCMEGGEKMLVYECMSNGSLDSYIFDSHKQERLDWKKRTMIIEGICRGLLYLHRDSRLRIIHRDLKASNILLDQELNPKIADFGMARIFGEKQDQTNTTRVVGTFGYMAPEYALEGRLSEKSDVYSFGVLLLEIMSGRKNTSFYNDEGAMSLIAYAWKLWNKDEIINLMDPIIYDPEMKPEISRYANVGLLCVEEMAQDRPNVCTILSMLSSEIVELPHPKQPAFLVNQRSHHQTEFLNKTSQSNCSINYVTQTTIEGR